MGTFKKHVLHVVCHTRGILGIFFCPGTDNDHSENAEGGKAAAQSLVKMDSQFEDAAKPIALANNTSNNRAHWLTAFLTGSSGSKHNPFEPEEELSKRLLVVGGGLAGLTASAEAAKAGYEVVLVEKAARLGGWMSKLYKQAPLKHPYTDLEDVDIADRIKAVDTDQNIKVYTGATMAKIEGAPCLYTAHIKQNGNVVTEQVGAIVVTTGAVPYEAKNLHHLGYGT